MLTLFSWLFLLWLCSGWPAWLALAAAAVLLAAAVAPFLPRRKR